MIQFPFRFSLRRLFAGVTLIAVILTFISMTRLAMRAAHPFAQYHREIQRLAISPDGTKLAIATATWIDGISGGSNFPKDVTRTISVLDVAKFPNCTTVEHEFGAGFGPHVSGFGWNLAFAPDGRSLRLLTKIWGHLQTWDLTANQWVSSSPTGNTTMLWFQQSPDGNWLQFLSQDGVKVLNTTTGELLKTESNKPLNIRSIQGDPTPFSKDGSRFVAVGRNEVRVWNLLQQEVVRTLNNITDDKYADGCMAFSPDGAWFAIRCEDGLRIYNLDSETHRVLVPAYVDVKSPNGLIESVNSGESISGSTYSPDGKLFVAWGSRGLKFFDATSDYKLVRSVSYSYKTNPYVRCLAFYPDGMTYAMGDCHGKLGIYDTATGKELHSAEVSQGGEEPPTLVKSK